MITSNINWNPKSGPAIDVTHAWYTCWRKEEGYIKQAGFFPPSNPNGKKNADLDMTLPNPETTLLKVYYSWLSCEGWSGGDIEDGIWTLKKADTSSSALTANKQGTAWITPK